MKHRVYMSASQLVLAK